MNSIRLWRLALCIFLCVLLIVGCSEASSEPEGVEVSALPEAPFGAAAEQVAFEAFPRLDGSTANLPLMRALAMYYTGITADEAELKVKTISTTDFSYYALENHQCDLLLVYEASPSTMEYMDNMDAFEMKPIGLDALVFICNEGNPVENLTTAQLQDIYTGKVTNWSEVGGEDVELVPYQRTELSGSQTMMEKLVMKDLPMTDAPTELRPGGMGGLVDLIAEYENTANALGYSVYYYIHNMYAVEGIKTLSVDGITPSNQSIQDGSYPFVNEFYAVIRSSEPEDSFTRQVFDFLTTEEGKRLIEQAGYVPG